MPSCQIKNVTISGISVVCGSKKIFLKDELDTYYDGDTGRLERIKKATGLNCRCVVEGPMTTTLDLAELAATRLFESLDIKRDSIDGLIFVTQTPDHFQPSNSSLLHGRLGLEKNVASLDVNLGCSGWVYGLWQAASLISSGGCKKILLISGDTLSQQVNLRDRSVAPLFGDGASATLIEQKENTVGLSFSLFTDGKGAKNICVPAGAFRQPLDESTSLETMDEEGNWRSANNLYVNGPEIFQFSLREVPKALKNFLVYSGINAQKSKFFVHQANGYILDTIRKRLKLDPQQMPITALQKFGNLSSASIPSVVCDSYAESLGSAVFCGFGVGLSWALASADLSETICLPIVSFN